MELRSLAFEVFRQTPNGETIADACPEPPIKSDTRILVADDHPASRSTTCQMLRRLAHVEVVGEAANAREAIERTRQLQPDLVIMELNMPVLDGLSAAQIIKGFSPQTAILMFSAHTKRLFMELAKGLGLNGFVTNEDDSADPLKGTEAVIHHKYYLAT